MPQIVWHVGDVVMKLREAKKWNQDRLCDHAGVHRTTVVDVESNAQGVTRRTYEKIAAALNVTVREMYALVPAPTSIPDRETVAPRLAALKDKIDREDAGEIKPKQKRRAR